MENNCFSDIPYDPQNLRSSTRTWNRGRLDFSLSNVGTRLWNGLKWNDDIKPPALCVECKRSRDEKEMQSLKDISKEGADFLFFCLFVFCLHFPGGDECMAKASDPVRSDTNLASRSKQQMTLLCRRRLGTILCKKSNPFPESGSIHRKRPSQHIERPNAASASAKLAGGSFEWQWFH